VVRRLSGTPAEAQAVDGRGKTAAAAVACAAPAKLEVGDEVEDLFVKSGKFRGLFVNKKLSTDLGLK
jgi:hypothetical protein